MENAARQKLDHSMTFEILGEGLRLFEGWALIARSLQFPQALLRQSHVMLQVISQISKSQFTIWTSTPCASYICHPAIILHIKVISKTW